MAARAQIHKEFAIAGRPGNESCMVLWVTHLPGDGGMDWGYSSKSEDALPLSTYWQRRFRADCEAINVTPAFYRALT